MGGRPPFWINCFKKIGGILNNYYNDATISEGSYNNSLILLQLSEDTQNTFGNLYFVTKVLRENDTEKYITFIRKCNKSFVDTDYIIDEIKLMTKLNNLYYTDSRVYSNVVLLNKLAAFNMNECDPTARLSNLINVLLTGSPFFE